MPTWIIGTIAGLIIIGGGGWYAASHSHPQGSAPAPAADSTAATAEAEGTFTGSLRELGARGGDYTCTMHTDSGNVPTDGTLYVSGENIRGDFASNYPQMGNVETHLIADGATLYLWSSLLAHGIKTDEMTESDTSADGSIDANRSYTYDCKAWSADASKFVLPTDITFAASGA
jgi:hypothetical protein